MDQTWGVRVRKKSWVRSRGLWEHQGQEGVPEGPDPAPAGRRHRERFSCNRVCGSSSTASAALAVFRHLIIFKVTVRIPFKGTHGSSIAHCFDLM